MNDLSNNSYLKLKGLEKQFGEVRTIKGIDLEIQRGEFVVFVGPSGCGKSTLLRLIAGLESIDQGSVELDGRDITQLASSKRDLAMVFQSYALYPHMSVYDNMSFALRMAKVEPALIKEKVERAAKILNLEPYLQRTPRELSGRQRQRVAIGRAIVRAPKVFLFDEPLSNLDAALRGQTRIEIARLHRELGATTIYVTHDQVEAMTMGTRICIMNRGRVVQVGAPLDVYRSPANTFVASFLGNPPMNLLPGVVTDVPGGRTIRVGESSVTVPDGRVTALAPGAAVTFGARPESISQEAGPPSQSTAALIAEIVQVERLGAETIVISRLPGLDKNVMVRISGDAAFTVGERRTLFLDLDAAHVFDADGNACTTI